MNRRNDISTRIVRLGLYCSLVLLSGCPGSQSDLDKALKDVKSSDVSMRLNALDRLVQHGTDDITVPILIKLLQEKDLEENVGNYLLLAKRETVVTEINKALQDPDYQAKNKAIKYLRVHSDYIAENSNSEGIVINLLALLYHEDLELYDETALVLTKVLSTQSAQDSPGHLLLKALLEDKNENVALRTAIILGRLGDNASEPLLRENTQHEKTAMRSRVILALGKLKSAQNLELFIKALQDKEVEVRKNAAMALAETGIKTAPPELIKALNDTHYEVRESSVDALGMIGDTAPLPLLVKALNDEEGSVSLFAIVALEDLNDKKAVQPLIELLKGGKSDHKGFIARALGSLGDPVALPALKDELRKAKNNNEHPLYLDEIKEAIKVLSQSKF